MKLMHLSDLHLGIRVNSLSLIEDQKYILSRILEIADAERPQAALIAGDVFDKSIPPVEAVQLFDDFLVSLADRGLRVFVISGNHDSAERIAFGGRLLEKANVHMSPVYTGIVKPVTLTDAHGPVDVYMLPFLRPAHVRRFFPEENIESYTQAMEAAISGMSIDPNRRNVLITHQFVTGAVRSESEDVSVGGADNVDASVFAAFDYVALGHLHKAQSVGRDTIRYCGTPLKYSFSEEKDEKSVTIVEMEAKGEVSVRAIPLRPLRDMRSIRGTYMELTDRRTYLGTAVDDFLSVTLTDEQDVPDALQRLRVIYPNILRLSYDNRRAHASGIDAQGERTRARRPMELIEAFYQGQNALPLTQYQHALTEKLIREIWEEEE